MPTTPNFALPYPAASDPADVPADMQELATAVDTAFVTDDGRLDDLNTRLATLEPTVPAARVAPGTNGQVLTTVGGAAAWAGGGGGGITVIQNVLLAVDTPSFDFTAIPATYQSIIVKAILRGAAAQPTVAVNVRVNNDSGANYDGEDLTGVNATPVSSRADALTQWALAAVTASTARAARPGTITLELFGYAGTTFEKICGIHGGHHDPAGPSARVDAAHGAWRSTAAINRVTVYPSTGNWAAGSRAILYGSV